MNATAQPDTDLLQAWRDGDRQAGDALVERHFAALFRFFRSKGVQDVDDLAHETFLVCLERQGTPWRSSFRAYLLGIARHMLFRRYRTAERAGRAASRALSSEQIVGSPSAEVARQDELTLLAGALRTIPIDLQITVELYYWESMTMAEIAEVIDVAEGTIKSRLSRARTLLKDRIAASPAPDRLRRATLDGFEDWAERLRENMGPSKK